MNEGGRALEMTVAPAGAGAAVGDFLALMKPRVMSLVVFTALVGLVLAPVAVHPLTALTALICIAAGAGASGALNMWYDADIDAVMRRTARRPIPRGSVTRDEALTFGATLAGGSVVVLGVLVNWTAATLLALTIGFYLFVYTMWLKRRTPQNIVIGGAAGALPPVVGWAAAAGGIGPEPLALFLIIFLWTPPHFWALALCRSDDYARAGVPMMPTVEGAATTRRQILVYAVATSLAAFGPVVLGTAGIVYAALAAVLGGLFVLGAVRVYLARDGVAADTAAKRLFGFSIVYLFALFAGLLCEATAGAAARAMGFAV